MDFFENHWQGKYSLPRSYWLNSVVIASLIMLVFAFVVGCLIGASASIAGVALPGKAVMDFVSAIISVPIIVWSIGGTWRSADAYSAARPDSSFTWGTAAKIALTFGTIKTILFVISTFMILVH